MLRDEDLHALKKLHAFAQANAFHYRIEYSEIEDRWELGMWGIGIGENFYVKKAARLADGIGYLMDKHAEQNKAPTL